jgi:predicted amidohydrolase
MHPTVALAQYPITYHRQFADWRHHVSSWVAEAARQQAQLLVFPEYGAMELVSLFSAELRSDIRAQVQALESLRPDFCAVFAALARQYQVIIVAPSIPVLVGQNIFNRAYVFSSKGLIGYQDKFFMTRFEDEDWGIHPAPKELSVFEASWGCFGIQICYDVEFALGTQWLAQNGATMIVAPSCTETIRGATRVHVGARARALENQCYTLVAQTVGEASWSPAVDLNYGYTACYCPPDHGLPEEGIVAIQPPQQPGWLVVSPDLSAIEYARTQGQVLNFKDSQLTYTAFKDHTISVKQLIT